MKIPSPITFFVLAGFVCASGPMQPPLAVGAGTPQPPHCGRSVYLAKFAPSTVAVADGEDITLPVGLLPHVVWSTDSDCAQPVSASLFLQVRAVIGDTTNVFPTTPVDLPAPRTPGPQFFSGPARVTLPAGTIPTNALPLACTVQGTYTVNFGTGAGGGSLSASGDVQVAMVKISPRILEVQSESLGRLGVEYLPLDKRGTELFQIAAPGDQINSFFLVSNNDPDQPVDLTIRARVTQEARLPVGVETLDAYNLGVYSLANPELQTERFTFEYTDNLDPGELLEQTSPDIVKTGSLSRVVNLLPGHSVVVPIATRSWGSSSPGSVNQINLSAKGTFGDGSPALGKASTLHLVGSVAQRTPGIRVTDYIEVSPNTEALYSPLFLFNGGIQVPGLTTFAAGNQGPVGDEFPEGIALVGTGLSDFNTHEYPSFAMDWLIAPQAFDTFGWFAYNYPQAPDVTGSVRNNVFVQNVDSIGKKGVRIPHVLPNPLRDTDSTFDVVYNAGNDGFTVLEDSQPVFSGTLRDFQKFKDLPIRYDSRSARTVTHLVDNRAIVDIRPIAPVINLTGESSPVQTHLELFIVPPLTEAKWKIGFKSKGSTLLEKSGEGNRTIPLLSDIPVLGNLFRQKSNLTASGKNLITFVMPVIIEGEDP